MMTADEALLHKYFPVLDPAAAERFHRLGSLYADWNEKINLISRKDIENLYQKHILHSLAISRFIKFKPGSKVLDLGTGGGFPGIPLAIFFPEATFTLVDSIAKKIGVVNDIINQLSLYNARALCSRAENIKGEFDYIVSRAAAPLPELYRWSRHLVSKVQKNAVPNGIICLKGGDLSEELKPFKGRVEVDELSSWFEEEFFKTKKLVFLAM